MKHAPSLRSDGATAHLGSLATDLRFELPQAAMREQELKAKREAERKAKLPQF